MRENELIRPSEKAPASGWCGEVGNVEHGIYTGSDQVVEEAEVHIGDELTVDDEAVGADDVNESVKPKMLRAPTTPSRQEVLEHNIKHWPFRD